jgi:hypothetical protein
VPETLGSLGEGNITSRYGTQPYREVALFKASLPPMSELQPGNDGEPLPDGEWVSRVCKKKFLSMNGEISELLFKPTSDDKTDPRHRLSVWVEKLTTEEHAYSLSNTTSKDAILARLNVDDIRCLRPQPDSMDVPHLQAEWHPLTLPDGNGGTIPDPRQGALGHSGIRDLLLGNKTQRRSLRAQLAKLAQQEFVQRNAGR